jgi:hypothetical protein
MDEVFGDQVIAHALEDPKGAELQRLDSVKREIVDTEVAA